MNRFPPELLSNVFIQLDLNERLICTIVCRNWWNVLDRTCLLHSINISLDESKFIRFMDMIKSSPHRAAQVQELILYNSISVDFDKREICNMFPNARVINVADAELYTPINPPIEQLEMRHSKSTVEVLHDSGHCELTLQIINSNMGERLKKLNLDFFNMTGIRPILSEFKNMPVLEELTLRLFLATVLDLEELHTKLPTIQILELEHIIPCASNLPRNISPATVTKLSYRPDEYDDVEALPTWYQYMSRKYTNVSEFFYTDYSLDDINMDTAQQLYGNGFLPFLQLIGPSTPHQVLLECQTESMYLRHWIIVTLKQSHSLSLAVKMEHCLNFLLSPNKPDMLKESS